MRRAVIALTEGGILLAQRIAEKTDCELYTLEKYNNGRGFLNIEGSLTAFMGQIFETYREIVLIMSCGIAVRSIAPHLESKLRDPAVVVMDEKGENVISLISGHIGGANSLAREIAEITRGRAVITTASDVCGIEAVDTMAERLGLSIEDFEAAKLVTACLVNGKKTGVIWDMEVKPMDIGNSIYPTDWDKIHKDNIEAVIYIGRKAIHEHTELSIPIVRLLPRSLVLGIGCRRDMEGEKIIAAAEGILAEYRLPRATIKAVATIDIKKDERGIAMLAEHLGVPLQIIASEEIKKYEQLFECSDFVRSSVGVGCVAEPAAYIASKQGSCILAKHKLGGITLSVYEEK